MKCHPHPTNAFEDSGFFHPLLVVWPKTKNTALNQINFFFRKKNPNAEMTGEPNKEWPAL